MHSMKMKFKKRKETKIVFSLNIYIIKILELNENMAY